MPELSLKDKMTIIKLPVLLNNPRVKDKAAIIRNEKNKDAIEKLFPDWSEDYEDLVLIGQINELYDNMMRENLQKLVDSLAYRHHEIPRGLRFLSARIDTEAEGKTRRKRTRRRRRKSHRRKSHRRKSHRRKQRNKQ